MVITQLRKQTEKFDHEAALFNKEAAWYRCEAARGSQKAESRIRLKYREEHKRVKLEFLNQIREEHEAGILNCSQLVNVSLFK